MNTLSQSFLILRNVDFIARYFPFFLQTSIRSCFSLEIAHPKEITFIYNSLHRKKVAVEEMFSGNIESLTPRILDDLSLKSSNFDDLKAVHLDSKLD